MSFFLSHTTHRTLDLPHASAVVLVCVEISVIRSEVEEGERDKARRKIDRISEIVLGEHETRLHNILSLLT
jgi:hypothetical protein